MHTLLMLLIVAASPAAPIEARYPQAVEVFGCGFEEEADRNYDNWPDRWTRQRGVEFPHYVGAKISAEPSPQGERCLRIDLDGGAAALYSPPIAIQPDSSYVLEAYLKTESLVHDEAYLTITYLDDKQQKLDTVRSDGVRDAVSWRKLRVGLASPPRSSARYAVVGLHLMPRDGLDLKGAALFDDLWLGSLPRMTVETSQPHNLFTSASQVQITCRLSGFTEAEGLLAFELFDALGQSVDRLNYPLHAVGKRAAGPAPAAAESKAALGREIPWKPRIDQPGFYRARVAMQAGERRILDRELTLAVIRPRRGVAGGEFGWSLPLGGEPLPPPALAQLLEQVGVSWIKYPLWFGEHEPEKVQTLVRFVERLSSQGIEIVGLLNDPPAELRAKFGDKSELSGADIFTPEPDVWYPAMEPVMTQLSMKVRQWQLGSDDDTSFVGYPNLSGKVAQIKKQLDRIGQDMRLGLGWRWVDEQPRGKPASWQFLTLSADPPLSAEELSTYLAAAPRQGPERWVAIQPLDRRSYSTATRAKDLLGRIVAAKMHGAERIFVPHPFSTQRGLMNDDGTPGELLGPWLMAAGTLSGAEYLGSLQLPGGSPNHVFARGAEAVMVAWSEAPHRETLYLGENLEQWDLWGRNLPLQTAAGRQGIDLGPLPTIVTGINLPVARCCLSLALADERFPSVFGQAHATSLRFKNWFPRGASGKLRLVTPEGWQTFPREFDLKLAAGEEATLGFEVRFPFDANSGPQDIRLDVQLATDRTDSFSVHRQIHIGLGDITLDAHTELSDNGELIVEQRLHNHTDKPVSFKCDLFAANRRRTRTQVLELGRGDDQQTYRLPAGKELLGQTLWIRAEEINGPRVFSHRFRAEE